MPNEYSFLKLISVTNRIFPKNKIEMVLFYLVTIGLVLVFAEVTAFTLYSFNHNTPHYSDITLNEIHADILFSTIGVVIKCYAILLFVRLILFTRQDIEALNSIVDIQEEEIPFAFDEHLRELTPYAILMETIKECMNEGRKSVGCYVTKDKITNEQCYCAISRLLYNPEKLDGSIKRVGILLELYHITRESFKPQYRLSILDQVSFQEFYNALQHLYDAKHFWITKENKAFLSAQGLEHTYSYCLKPFQKDITYDTVRMEIFGMYLNNTSISAEELNY